MFLVFIISYGITLITIHNLFHISKAVSYFNHVLKIFFFSISTIHYNLCIPKYHEMESEKLIPTTFKTKLNINIHKVEIGHWSKPKLSDYSSANQHVSTYKT